MAGFFQIRISSADASEGVKVELIQGFYCVDNYLPPASDVRDMLEVDGDGTQRIPISQSSDLNLKEHSESQQKSSVFDQIRSRGKPVQVGHRDSDRVCSAIAKPVCDRYTLLP